MPPKPNQQLSAELKAIIERTGAALGDDEQEADPTRAVKGIEEAAAASALKKKPTEPRLGNVYSTTYSRILSSNRDDTVAYLRVVSSRILREYR